MTITLPEPTIAPQDEDEDVNHFVCPCNEDIAFCGKDVRDAEWRFPGSDDEMCRLCMITFYEEGCPRCGQ